MAVVECCVTVGCHCLRLWGCHGVLSVLFGVIGGCGQRVGDTT